MIAVPPAPGGQVPGAALPGAAAPLRRSRADALESVVMSCDNHGAIAVIAKLKFQSYTKL